MRRWNRAMRLVRRVHLYSGLFLFPWVLLYGVTAMLFNHPGVLPDIAIESIPAAAPDSPLSGLPTATETADRVVKALREKSPGQFSDLAIVSAAPPFYPFGAPATAKGEGQEFNLSIEMTDGSGVIRARPIPTVETAGPFARPVPVALESPTIDRVTEGVKQVLKERGHEVESVTFRGPPDLYFQVALGGQTWPVKYSAVNGTLTGVQPLSWRGYFLRLHTAHHFPSALGPRWFWALAVDVMFLAMVFWGISGLFMWWQIRSVRWVGLATVALGAVLALWMGFAMHGAMIN